MIKVLMIGQLPKEFGGNYTTGAAKVLLELSKQKTKDTELYTFATNAKNKEVARCSHNSIHYYGYSLLLWDIIIDFIFHPIKCIREWHHYKYVDHENPLRYAFYKANIQRVIKKVGPDIIHVHSIGNVSPVKFALGNSKTPVLLTCHGIFYRGEASGKLRDIHLGNIKLADYYTGLTEESCEEYERFLGVKREEVTVIPNGVDCKKFYFDKEKRKDIRKVFNLRDETKVFITVASVQERKGQLAFVKLLQRLDLDCQYWIIGEGPDMTIIEDYINNGGLSDKIKLLGYKNSDELYAYYSAADIYAHVSTKEGQALCEIEARATGLRVIVNEPIVGTVPNIDSYNYFILNMDTPDNKALKEWVNSESIERKSDTSLDWSVIATKYAVLYHEIINKKDYYWRISVFKQENCNKCN